MVDEEKKDKAETVEKEKPAKAAKEKPAKAAKEKPEKAEKPAKEKKDKPKKEKKEAGPSRKLTLYTEWAKSKQKLTAEQLHKTQPDLSLNTIKGWVKGWANGKRLPAGAKK